MKLKTEVIEKINTRQVRASLMQALGFSEIWITKVINANKVNGPLTTASALNAIKKETGLTDEEILEDVETEPVAPSKESVHPSKKVA